MRCPPVYGRFKSNALNGNGVVTALAGYVGAKRFGSNIQCLHTIVEAGHRPQHAACKVEMKLLLPLLLLLRLRHWHDAASQIDHLNWWRGVAGLCHTAAHMGCP
jgi:hypothetical protein